MNARPHAFAFVEVPEGRHNVAHRLNGGARRSIIRSPGGAEHGQRCAAPPGLSPLHLRRPTAHAVGYVLSSLTGLGHDE